MAKNNSNLVRPRTISQDSPSSLSSLHNHHDAARKRQRHSCQELFLCGACMFLFILCACLITILVLVSHSLQSGALLSHCTNLSSSARTTPTTASSSSNESDKSFWYKLLDFATTKIFTNKHLIRLGGGNYVTDSEIASTRNYNSSSDLDSAHNNSMVYQSKVIDQLSWRLPREIVPKHYELFLHPDFDTQSFSGNVSIRLALSRPISFIAVHAKFLNITETKVLSESADGGATHHVPIARAFAYPKFDYWVVEFDDQLNGDYVLYLEFNGKLNGKMTGFYSSSYKDVENNQTR